WQARSEQAADGAKKLQAELRQFERKKERLLDRILETDDPDLRRAYEERLSKLQKQELELEDSLVALDRPKSNFHDMFEPAMEVLANPHRIWKNGSYAWRRAILRLAFASDVVYAHDEGL